MKFIKKIISKLRTKKEPYTVFTVKRVKPWFMSDKEFYKWLKKNDLDESDFET